MTEWNLSLILEGLHNTIQQRLDTARGSFGHPVALGDASENVWIELLQKYLPQRYQTVKGTVVDSDGNFSDQIDIIIFDRQYSPFILNYEKQIVVPAESVYAVFESKQKVNADMISYSQKKVTSVRKLKRTSLPIPHAGGTYPAKDPPSILGGILAFESDWSPPLGDTIIKALQNGTGDGRVDLGCVAAHGHFFLNEDGEYKMTLAGKPATAFLFRLISSLQLSGTVPMINVLSYARWLDL